MDTAAPTIVSLLSRTNFLAATKPYAHWPLFPQSVDHVPRVNSGGIFFESAAGPVTVPTWTFLVLVDGPIAGQRSAVDQRKIHLELYYPSMACPLTVDTSELDRPRPSF